MAARLQVGKMFRVYSMSNVSYPIYHSRFDGEHGRRERYIVPGETFVVIDITHIKGNMLDVKILTETAELRSMLLVDDYVGTFEQVNA